jgi:hypothetical protein
MSWRTELQNTRGGRALQMNRETRIRFVFCARPRRDTGAHVCVGRSECVGPAEAPCVRGPSGHISASIYLNALSLGPFVPLARLHCVCDFGLSICSVRTKCSGPVSQPRGVWRRHFLRVFCRQRAPRRLISRGRARVYTHLCFKIW